jgi:hypothetical protein
LYPPKMQAKLSGALFEKSLNSQIKKMS